MISAKVSTKCQALTFKVTELNQLLILLSQVISMHSIIFEDNSTRRNGFDAGLVL